MQDITELQLQKELPYIGAGSYGILEQKSKNLEETSNKNIKTLLDPLNQDLKNFKDKVDKVYNDEARERHSLESQVKMLVQTSTQVSQQAEKLTNALKGNVKQFPDRLIDNSELIGE